MLKNDYTTALLSLLEEGKDIETLLAGLKAQLARKGHSALLPHILKGLARKLAQQEYARVPQVSVARDGDVKKLEKEIQTILAQLTTETAYTTTVDESLIGGVVVEHENKIIDTSYKKQLLALYRALTI